MVIVAQLVRVLVCGAGGRGFEAHQSPIKREGELIVCSPFILYIFLVFSKGALLGYFQES